MGVSIFAAYSSVRRAGRRLAVLASAGLLTITGTVAVVTVTAVRPAGAACTAKTQPDRGSAQRLARACKKRVPVTGATTSTSTLVANENGSFTATESAVPERIRRADGTWVPVDTTLKVNGDGTVSPVASPTAVILSGGGTGFLAKTAHDGQELVWTWTGHSLPAPVLAGDVATYPAVLPDVDLQLLVDRWGFAEVLVVKTAAAAADPELATLRFALSGTAVNPAASAGTATTPAQAVSGAFEIGAAYMWDSTVPATIPAGMPAVDVRSETVSTAGGPGSAAKVVPVPVGMDGSTLVVTPARDLLTDRTAKFPIYIDPKSTSPARSYWAMINSQHPAQQYWTYDRADHAKVGNAGTGDDMYRSLFQFSTATWKGKHVTDVTFADNLVHSWSCSNTTTELHLVRQSLGSNTTWNLNAPAWAGSLATVSNQNCHDASGVASEWHSADLTTAINDTRGNATVTLGLRAANETVSNDGSNGWKKFDETSNSGGAHLSVTYNTTPVLSNAHTDAATCATSSTSAPLLSTVGSPAHNPVPQVTVTDGESDKTTVAFTYPKAGGGTSTTTYSNVASGASQKLVAGIAAAAIPSGGTYSWKATVSDGTDSATITCYFKIDNTVPQRPSVVSADGLYPDDDTTHGGVGRPGRFTIAATGTDANKVVKYVWGPLTGGPAKTVTTTAGAPVTVSFTPSVVGDNTIQATAYSATGVVSAPGSAEFLVGSPTGPVGSWALDGSGADTGTGNHTLTASNVAWTANNRIIGQKVATFNGSSSVLTGPTVLHTNTSFSVSAWVRPTFATCTGNAVEQDGGHTAGFYLGCFEGKFDFDVIQTDSVTIYTTRASAIAAAPMGVWSNIVGVYDLSAGTIELYVNGVNQGTTKTLTAPLWDATGALTIGRTHYNDTFSSYWDGDVADVRVWDRKIYQSDVDGLTTSSWADQFPLNDPTRNTKRDNPLVWYGTPDTTVDDMNPPDAGGTPAVLINPTGGQVHAATAGPSVRTDGSFTVSAWINTYNLTNGNLSAVAQNGATASAFSLGISSSNQYQLRMNNADTATPAGNVVVAPGTAVIGQWVHLVGTFDFATKQLALYVNGVQKGTKTYAGTPWHANGPLMIGAAWWNASLVDCWYGGIDNVGVFNGVLSGTQIQNLYRYNDPFYAAG